MPLTETNSQATAARAFVRSLNILLKFTRLYGFEHARTSGQFQSTWQELRSALPADSEAGLLLAAAGSQLLLDGSALGSSLAERNFAQMLTGVGLASIHFSPAISQEDLGRFVRAFPSGGGGGGQTASLAEQFKKALEDVSSIRLNEICFVAADSGNASLKVAADITARMFGGGSREAENWFNNPQKLLQLIAAAEGSKGGAGGFGAGPGGGEASGGPGGNGNLGGAGGGSGPEGGGGGGFGAGENGRGGSGGVGIGTSGSGGAGGGLGAGTGGSGGGGRFPGGGRNDAPPKGSWARLKSLLGTPTAGTELFFPEEEDVHGILRLLRQFSKDCVDTNAEPDPDVFQQRLTDLAPSARFRFRDALAALAAQAPVDRPAEPLLVRLAEHLAIRYALESYERGETRVSAVRQMLDRMGQEIEALRKVLVSHEAKLAGAGVVVEPYTDLLDRQFWAAVPEETKRGTLLSAEAWCVPPRNVNQYVREQLRLGDKDTGQQILNNYVSGITHNNADARRKTAAGLCELAELYGEDRALLTSAIGRVGAQLITEQDSELRSQVCAAFVRLSQEAAARRYYSALQQTLASLEALEAKQPTFAQSLRPRTGLEGHIPEFIEDALRDEFIPEDLAGLLQRMPRAAAQQVTRRFGRAGFREDCDLLISLSRQLGPEGDAYLRDTFTSGSPVDAMETIGLLSRLDEDLLQKGLPARLREFPRSFHDRTVRQLAAGGSLERGRLLVAVFECLDPMIRPLALDEIGMSGDAAAIPWLVSLAEQDLGAGGPFLRLKAIEALGRLRAREAALVLRHIVETKQVWQWMHPSELRIVAMQALAKIDFDWLQAFVPKSGLEADYLSFPSLDRDPEASGIRQRRYPRLRLGKPVLANTTNLKQNSQLEIQSLNLGGGIATANRHLPSGTMLTIKIASGFHSIGAQAFVRDVRERTMAFEIAEISMEDRARLRRLLAKLGGGPPTGSPKNRVRRQKSAKSTKH